MTKKILITGDRSLHPLQAVSAVAAALNLTVEQHGLDIEFLVGDMGFGVERAARYLLPQASLFVYDRDETTGKADLDSTYARLIPEVDGVVFIHTAPLTSHIGAALLGAFPPEKLFIPEFN